MKTQALIAAMYSSYSYNFESAGFDRCDQCADNVGENNLITQDNNACICARCNDAKQPLETEINITTDINAMIAHIAKHNSFDQQRLIALLKSARDEIQAAQNHAENPEPWPEELPAKPF